jgi:hypothetical protein
MRGAFRHPVTVIAVAVALMSGILSILREFLLFQYPTKFQERPLFWASVRIAFAISLIVLWYGERQKRLELDKAPERTPSLKEQTFKLSTAILEFIYERAAAAPKISPPPRFPNFGGGADWLEALDKSDHEHRALLAHEKETLEIYELRYKRDVAKAIASLKSLGLDSSGLEECVVGLSNESDPNYSGIRIVISEWIKGVGRHLAALADQI